MPIKRKIKKTKMTDEEVDHLIDHWIASIDDLRDFFFEHSPEEQGDDFYDMFLEKFHSVEKIFRVMVKEKMIIQETIRERDERLEAEQEEDEFEEVIEPKTVKGIRNDN